VSRFDCDYDYEDEYAELHRGRWDWNLEQATKGRKGQQALRQLEAALLAMPQHRLVDSELATPAGEVCAVGAAIAYAEAQRHGIPFDEAARRLAAEDESWAGFEQAAEDDPDGEYREGDWIRTTYPSWIGCDWPISREVLPGVPRRVSVGRVEVRKGDEEGCDRTAREGKRAGFVYTLAWQVGYMNDDPYLFGKLSPEDRWDAMLRWVRSKITA
jgi:hypothetical protein